MRKSFILFSFLLCFGSIAFGQENVLSRIKLQAAYNLGTTTEKSGILSKTHDLVPGFSGGALYYHKLNTEYGLESGILFNNTGMEGADPHRYKLMFNFLTVPVLFRFEITNSFQLYAGGGVSFLINAYQKNISGPFQDVRMDLTPMFNRVEVSSILGADFNIPKSPVAIFLQAQRGHTNIIDKDAIEVLIGQEFDGSLKTFTGSLGFKFYLKK